VSKGGRETEDGLKSAVVKEGEKEVVVPTVSRQPARRTAGGRTGEEEDGEGFGEPSVPSPVGGKSFFFFEMGGNLRWSEHNIRNLRVCLVD
jgi:hypothetical protein